MSRAEMEGSRAVRSPGLADDVAELRRAALRGRWSLGLMAIAWVHLATFTASHALYRGGDRTPGRYLAVWGLEFAAVVVLARRMVTDGGRRPAPPLVGLLARIWGTFLILGFSVASLNTMTGSPPDWFKPAWATLSTFGLAMMAWVVSLWFLVPAVQMSLAALLMARYLEQAYLTYAVSWWLVLITVALAVEKARRAAVATGGIDRADDPAWDEPGEAVGIGPEARGN